jgi:transcription initiation factor TFIIIB Brf1 subunit/transcription initiation factor TFIIB
MKQELTPERGKEILLALHADRKQIAKTYFAKARKELQGE